MSKGSARRPQQVSDDDMEKAWDAIFSEVITKHTTDLESTSLRWHGLSVVITDWEFYGPGGVIKDPWPIRVKIFGEDNIGDFFHTWVEQEEVTVER